VSQTNTQTNESKTVAVVGAGPAGLMVATVLADAGFVVTVYDQAAQTGRKLFIAGASGLNVSTSLEGAELLARYSGPEGHWLTCLRGFSVKDWLDFIEKLGLEWFQGTSARYFVRPMNAAPLVRAWRKYLQDRQTNFVVSEELVDFAQDDSGITLKFKHGLSAKFDAVCLALGGGSYLESGDRPAWANVLKEKGIRVEEMKAANVGFEVKWSQAMLAEAEGKPLKNICLKTSLGERLGELVVTSYGLEGTPLYEMGNEGVAHLDLKPDLTCLEVEERLRQGKENLNPVRRMRKHLRLSPAIEALVFHHGDTDALKDVASLAKLLKKFPVVLERRRPMQEAISTSGGVKFSEVDEALMLKKFSGIFLAGEMLDWSAPTGGFLIQGCVSQGHFVGVNMARYLQADNYRTVK
jgi:uncharacterized flavoprotein (TIGR03862 family)